MRANRSRDTGPELAVRRELHGRGLRYRVSYRPLPGARRSVDIAFVTARIAVMIDGCFWHGCPEHHRRPHSNVEYWTGKVAKNRARDAETDLMLTAAGWTVLRFWEHEPAGDVVDTVAAEVAARRQGPPEPAG